MIHNSDFSRAKVPSISDLNHKCLNYNTFVSAVSAVTGNLQYSVFSTNFLEKRDKIFTTQEG